MANSSKAGEKPEVIDIFAKALETITSKIETSTVKGTCISINFVEEYYKLTDEVRADGSRISKKTNNIEESDETRTRGIMILRGESGKSLYFRSTSALTKAGVNKTNIGNFIGKPVEVEFNVEDYVDKDGMKQYCAKPLNYLFENTMETVKRLGIVMSIAS